ncbi:MULTISPECIES: copper resistance system multicopper oxidase [unclassified Methylophaga]|jgi:CopA family copper-resistance protein|uniref:copper resistance system multicopper oxidase n=2 Tax=Methylophaga TaxID=40222 RepID=UPI000C8DE176|nr:MULTISPECIES: copper resistance system multicopper oxidase [unclassified Methylophaga]MAP25307.1 copper resistance protein CopA [Methylophaga sp.]MDX1751416.1 copper resistance system multicopper oxidase [Methylophaga sp.]|tara:strand:- start:2700 stop:4475 length:1776 start_codon:yes stop_codon:yes gene_type:complete
MANSVEENRRRFIKSAIGTASALVLAKMAPAWAYPLGRSYGDVIHAQNVVDLHIRREDMNVAGRIARPITINGSMPGPLIRLKEGQRAKLHVSNALDESTSIHWHGIILPENMDGVPGVSFPGIKAGESYHYEYDVQQSGTYWYHSHSGLQEQLGHFGPLVIDPADGDIGADREHVIILSDWTFEDPDEVFRNLKVAEGYYNYQQRTLGDTFDDIRRQGLAKTWQERSMWNEMRMSARDLLDVTGSTYTYLMNGRDNSTNWTALYKPGEKIRLRIINGSAMSFFDFRIPGLEMTVVSADGQPIKPVTVDEFRIGVAETYDVIVTPKNDRPYTLFAESMDRSGYVRGTLATELGQEAPVPELRPVPERGMAAMGMSHEMGGMDMITTNEDQLGMDDHQEMSGGHGGHKAATQQRPSAPDLGIEHAPGGHGPGAAMIARNPVSRLNEPGIGLENVDHRVLVYGDLIGAHPWPDDREPERDIELHLTGNMEKYMWSFDGVKYTEVNGPVEFHHGERLRLIMVNDTMMDHPIHLHGMWMELENGQYPRPRKHTISLKPSEVVSLQISADAPGSWAFHCHLLYHMKAGMFRVVRVS